MTDNLIFSDINSPLLIERLHCPFAALIDINDREWSSASWSRKKIIELLEAGCRYFVCFGSNSEGIHDQIDDIIVEDGYLEEVITTFHNDEHFDDVVLFFRTVALGGVPQGLVLVGDVDGWQSKFSIPIGK